MDCHTTTALCNVPADVAFAFMADGLALGGWALGSFGTRDIGDGTFVGRTLDSDVETYLRPSPYPEHGLIIYEVGDQPDKLEPWIWAVVHPGERLGFDAGSSVVSVLAWRLALFSDKDWSDLKAYHNAEILLIKGQLERGRVQPRSWGAASS